MSGLSAAKKSPHFSEEASGGQWRPQNSSEYDSPLIIAIISNPPKFPPPIPSPFPFPPQQRMTKT